MKITDFEFTPGAHFQKGAHRNPKEVGERLELLRSSKNGELTAEDVLADARNPNSPLHSFFEWDDSAAAHEHRLSQARHLIRTVVAVYKENPNGAETRTRAYVHIRQAETPHYRETSEALSVPDTRHEVINSALRELNLFKARYQDLVEFAEVIQAAQNVQARLSRKRPRAVKAA